MVDISTVTTNTPHSPSRVESRPLTPAPRSDWGFNSRKRSHWDSVSSSSFLRVLPSCLFLFISLLPFKVSSSSSSHSTTHLSPCQVGKPPYIRTTQEYSWTCHTLLVFNNSHSKTFPYDTTGIFRIKNVSVVWRGSGDPSINGLGAWLHTTYEYTRIFEEKKISSDSNSRWWKSTPQLESACLRPTSPVTSLVWTTITFEWQ